MKRYITKTVALFIAFLFIFFSVGCQNDNNSPNENGADFSTKSFELNANYMIVSHNLYKQTTEMSDAIILIKDALKSVCGIDASFTTDTTKKGENAKRYEYEILLGYTNTEETKQVASDLGINDFTYQIISENVIVIYGGSLSSTYEAAKKFCLDVLGYNADSKTYEKKTVTVTEGESYTYRDTYTHSSLTLNDIPIEKFSIALESSKDMQLAQKIVKHFGAYTGFSIPIVKFSELDGSEAGVICIGSYDREQNHSYESLTYGGEMHFSNSDGKLTIGVDATDTEYYDDITKKLFETSDVKIIEKDVSLSLPDNNIIIHDLDRTYGDIPEWTLVKETKQEIRDGVTYIEQKYTDEKKLPYKAYILLIDPEKASFYMGTANDMYTTTPEEDERQSVVGQMKSAVANGIDVIAGTNGDFFDISGNYSPAGLAIKEGQYLSCSNNTRPYIAFMNDGSIIISHDARKVDVSNIRTAIAGRQVIVYNSLPHNLEKTTSLGTTAHPRTLFGIKKDGTVIMAVIDGRQPSLSNGASLALCAKFMISLGADSAINLDGGGSSTMVIRNENNYAVKNSPSDGAPRKIFNSLIVTAKN